MIAVLLVPAPHLIAWLTHPVIVSLESHVTFIALAMSGVGVVCNRWKARRATARLNRRATVPALLPAHARRDPAGQLDLPFDS